MLLHTHVVAAAKSILKLYPVTSVTELAKMILVNFIRLPQIESDPVGSAGEYISMQLNCYLWGSCGMASMMRRWGKNFEALEVYASDFQDI